MVTTRQIELAAPTSWVAPGGKQPLVKGRFIGVQALGERSGRLMLGATGPFAFGTLLLTQGGSSTVIKNP